jgi:hypothetical protein
VLTGRLGRGNRLNGPWWHFPDGATREESSDD